MGQRRVTEAFVGNEEAREMLGFPPGQRSNVAKTLDRHGVPSQTLTVGRRVMKVYLRDDVERVARVREEKRRAKAKAAK